MTVYSSRNVPKCAECRVTAGDCSKYHIYPYVTFKWWRSLSQNVIWNTHLYSTLAPIRKHWLEISNIVSRTYGRHVADIHLCFVNKMVAFCLKIFSSMHHWQYPWIAFCCDLMTPVNKTFCYPVLKKTHCAIRHHGPPRICAHMHVNRCKHCYLIFVMQWKLFGNTLYHFWHMRSGKCV